MANEWGPLAALAGEWEGDGGLDTAFSHGRQEVLATRYVEKLTFTPFGPVDNGDQRVYGLDYRTAMWAGGDEVPFHMEVGYWTWDAATGEITRGFVVPRGITVLAGGTAAPDATSFDLTAELGGTNYTVGQNRYLADRASSVAYRVHVTIDDADTWSYDETTTLRMTEIPGAFAHTDRNTLHRVRR